MKTTKNEVLESQPRNDGPTSKTLPVYSDNDEFHESPRQTVINDDEIKKDDSNTLKTHSSHEFTTYASFHRRYSSRLQGRTINESRMSTSQFKDIENLSECQLTWKRFGLAIDVVWQILILATLITFTSILLVQAIDHR